jgi:hypothetical protein
MMLPTYLGDGVYAYMDEAYQVWLYTDRIIGRHEVALELEVFKQFLEYVSGLDKIFQTLIQNQAEANRVAEKPQPNEKK